MLNIKSAFDRFQSMALTVDAAWYGNRERDIRKEQIFNQRKLKKYLDTIEVSDYLFIPHIYV